MRRSAKIVISAALLFLLGAGLAVYEGVYDPLPAEYVSVDGLQRKFHYHVPKSISAHPGLLFVLHGSTISGNTMRLITGHEFDSFADESQDMIVVYPDGFHNYWNDCRKSGSYESKKRALDDVGFIEKIVGYFSGKFDVDQKRIFAVGHSNGGHMVFKLAAQKPGLFRAFAAVSASLPAAENNDCFSVNQPVSMMIVNGTADPINPYDGGPVVLSDGMNRGSVVSTDDTIQYWLGVNHCANTLPIHREYPITVNKEKNSAKRTDYLCSNSKKIVLISIVNGGHNVPNQGINFWPKSTGNMAKGIDVPRIVWDFFVREPK